MRSISHCPVCGGDKFTHFLSCADHSVSHETFSLLRCDSCAMVCTSPRPETDSLGRYYLSEDYISHSTKARTLFEKIYRAARILNLKWKLRIVRDHAPPGAINLLDFGCGTGEFLHRAEREGFRVAGVEPSSKARRFAQELTSGPITEKLPIETETYDVITLWHVLEHIPELNEEFALLSRAMKKDGTMFIAVPNHQSADAIHYTNHWAAYDVPRHLWHFTKASMDRFLKRHSLKLMNITPMKMDSFYVSMLSEQYLAGRRTIGGAIKGFKNGLASNIAAAKTKEYSSLIYVVRK